MDNQVALITGAGSGIGHALAIGFATAGIDLVLVDLNAEHLEEVKAECEALGRTVVAAPADVRNYEQVQEAVQAGIAAFGKIDVLVNNAGYSRMKRIERITVEEFQAILSINVIGVYNFAHAVAPSMLEKQHGAIINTGSMAAKMPVSKLSAYAMSKASLIGFTESLAEELKKSGITVNTIMPNSVDTPLFREGLTEEQVKMINPMKPEELVPFFLFFTTESAKKSTGWCVDVDLVRKVASMGAAEAITSWQALEPIAKEKKISEDSLKSIRKWRALVEYLLTTPAA
ncbi:MAG TPA: SDR family oxidoreductase [Candidatus Lokiarchaeia archaeon]|nr:SDR family oxidoreductase [Candidatus Lokiarchaeia archaeon]